MSISAIILHYWVERTHQLYQIVRDLNRGTVVPDKIVVFNNNKEIRLASPPDLDVVIVNSNYNFHCLIRYALGLLMETDHCLFIDDDLTVTDNTLEYLLDYHQVRPEAVLGFFGKNLGEDQEHPYTSGEEVRHVEGPRRADLILGRLQFCKTSKLVNVFKLKNLVPDLLIEGVIEEDILLSFSSRILDSAENVVLPPKIQELSEMGTGYHYTDAHYSRRDETCRKILAYERSMYFGEEPQAG